LITLTAPWLSTTDLGGVSGISYDTFEVISLTFDLVNKIITGICQLISKAAPMSPAILGNLTINNNTITVSFPGADINTSINLNVAQQAALSLGCANAQNNTETAIVNIGAVIGVQTLGL